MGRPWSAAALLCIVALAMGGSVTCQKMKATPFKLMDVNLTGNGYVIQAQKLNTQYLKYLELDRLLLNFYNVSGLPTIAEPYGGWEAPNVLLRGHFVGHYLSALAFTFASTGDDEILEKSNTLVTELKRCQDAIGTGYLSAYPLDQIERLENLETPVWAPYYTIHKIMAGLLDTYENIGNQDAMDIMTKMASYFKGRIDAVLKAKGWSYWQEILNTEFGGMNEVMYNLYAWTNDTDHLTMAQYFYKQKMWDPMSRGVDSLQGNHANTHIPQIIGLARGWEVTDNGTLRTITEEFKETIDERYTYSTGGSNVNEYWNYPYEMGTAVNTSVDSSGDVDHKSFGLHTQETCTQYNILKVVRHMFQWSPDAKKADDYERKILNGIMGVQKPATMGEMLYMTPLGHGVYKGIANGGEGYGSTDNSFWCCYGTAVESFGKIGDSIYFEDSSGLPVPTLYIAQFFSSALMWENQNLTVTQNAEMSDDSYSMKVSLTVKGVDGANIPDMVNIRMRVPGWSRPELTKIYVGSKIIADRPTPGSFFEFACDLTAGGRCNMQATLGMGPTLERLNDHRDEFENTYSILWGPYVLAGETDGDNTLDVSPSNPDEWISPVGPLKFLAQGRTKQIQFQPLSMMYEEKYALYWDMTA